MEKSEEQVAILTGSSQPPEMEITAHSGVEVIEQMCDFFIKQKPLWCPCNNQKFTVYKLETGEKKTGRKLFSVKENSTPYHRYCCHPCCRQFELIISAFVKNEKNRIIKVPFLRIFRPYKCMCCCWCRPYMKVYHVEGGGRRIYWCC